MTELIILTVAVLAFCGASAAITIRADKRAAKAEETAQRALNTAEKTIIEAKDKMRVLEGALGGANIHFQELRKENAAMRDELGKIRELIPEDVKEERTRRNVLMSQLNDELETRIRAEREWNAMVSSVLGYDLNKARAAGVKNNDE